MSSAYSSAVPNMNHGQNHAPAMMCDEYASDDKHNLMVTNTTHSHTHANLLNHNAAAMQQAVINPLAAASSSANHNLLTNPLLHQANTAHQQAQLVQVLQQQQQQEQQLQMQLQMHLQQATAQPFSAIAQWIANAASMNNNTSTTPSTSNSTAAALQTALLLQQQQQQQQQQLEFLARTRSHQGVVVVPPSVQDAAAAIQHMTHNLIPKHLQANSLAASLDGTPGYQPALILPPNSGVTTSTTTTNTATTTPNNNINSTGTTTASNSNNSNNNNTTSTTTATTTPNPLNLVANLTIPSIPLTVQDDILLNPNNTIIPPIFNGVNLQYPGLRQLHATPPVYAVDNFLTPNECQFLIHAASDVFQPAPVVGKGAGEISASRTSSTCYLARQDLPEYMRKVRLLTGKSIETCELPQVGRYLPTQQYMQHYDAFDLSDENGRRFAANGGQRVVTVLVYLNTLTAQQGGATHFPNLNLTVQPQQGMAIVFFPSTVDGLLDKRALHAALPPCGADATKYVSQVWIRQSEYKGDASKRLNPIMGIQNYEPPNVMDVLKLKAAAAAAAGGGTVV